MFLNCISCAKYSSEFQRSWSEDSDRRSHTCTCAFIVVRLRKIEVVSLTSDVKSSLTHEWWNHSPLPFNKHSFSPGSKRLPWDQTRPAEISRRAFQPCLSNEAVLSTAKAGLLAPTPADNGLAKLLQQRARSLLAREENNPLQHVLSDRSGLLTPAQPQHCLSSIVTPFTEGSNLVKCAKGWKCLTVAALKTVSVSNKTSYLAERCNCLWLLEWQACTVFIHDFSRENGKWGWPI